MDEQDIRKVFNRMSVMKAHLNEHGIEPFYELAKSNPEKAVDEFPKTLDNILQAGSGFFSGKMCGGPYPGATISMLNVLGGIYPNVSKELREKVLEKAMNFLDGQNYPLSQENVGGIDEPWLVRDIILTRPLYWPGYGDYAGKLKNCETWEDVDLSFINIDSPFWLAYTISHNEHSTPQIKDAFSANFPEVMDRTKDTIACWKAGDAACQHLFYKKEYLPVLYSELAKFPEEWREDLIERINKKDWIMLPDRHRKNAPLIEFLSGKDSKV